MVDIKTYQERLKKLKLKFTKVDDGFYRVETLVKPFDKSRNAIYYPIALINQLNYGKKYWQIEYNNKHFIDNNGYDCFSFKIAKQLIKDTFYNDYNLFTSIHNKGYEV